jgi:hypothetical protein
MCGKRDLSGSGRPTFAEQVMAGGTINELGRTLNQHGMDRLAQCRAVRTVHSGMFWGPADASGFYNPGGWGPAIVANFPPLIWFLVVGVVLIRESRPLN